MTPNEIERYMSFWFYWVRKNMIVGGRIERYVLLLDMKDVKVRDFPLTKLKPMLENLNILFKAAAYRDIFVNQGWFLNKVISIVASWLPAYTQHLFVIANEEETFSTLLQYMSADEIEMKYGGNKPPSN